MTLLKNIQNLQDESIIATPDGAFTFKENNRLIHSRRSPLKEAERLIENIKPTDKNSTIVILWGVGLGYHANLLLKQNYKIIAVEPRPKTAKLFKQIFPTDQLIGIIENNPQELFDLLVNLKPFESLTFIDIVMMGLDIPVELLKYAEQAKNALRSTHTVHSYLMEYWHHHIFKNIQNATVTFEPIFKGQELAICSAGPSLKQSLPHLKRLEKKLTILAVDTALMSLLEDNIIPDYVYSVDAKIHNIGDFAGIPLSIISEITLLADITVSPQIVELPWKQVLFTSTVQPMNNKNGFFVSRIKLLQLLWDHGIKFPELQTGGSVANTAFHAGIFYQADKILLIGQDLAYSDYRGHATGSPYDREYRLLTNRLNTLDSIHIKKVPFEYPVIGINKKETYSDPLLIQFRSWFETSLKDNSHLQNYIINASEAGSYFDGWQHIPLSSYNTSANKKISNITPKQFEKEKINKLFCILKNQQIDLDSENLQIKEYFYYEHTHKEYKSFKLERKINRIKKTLSTYK